MGAWHPKLLGNSENHNRFLFKNLINENKNDEEHTKIELMWIQYLTGKDINKWGR